MFNRAKFDKHSIMSILFSISMIIILLLAFANINNSPKIESTKALAKEMNNTEKVVTKTIDLKQAGVEELKEKRLANVKYYKNTNGKFVAKIYSTPIHFKNQIGEWEDIDNSLVALDTPNSEYKYQNKANDFKAFFVDNYKGGKVYSFNQDDKKVEYSFIGGREVQPKIEKNKGKFENILEGIDINYEVRDYGVKENIVINKPTDINSFSFELKLTGVELRKEENGRISVIDQKTKKVLWILEKPYMDDAKHKHSNDVYYDLINENGKVLVKVVAKKEWMNDKSRKYPIIIDPGTYKDTKPVRPGPGDGRDTYIDSYNPETNYRTEQTLYTGFNEFGDEAGRFISLICRVFAMKV